MSHHEAEHGEAAPTEGAVGVPPVEPTAGGAAEGSFDFWLLGLLLLVGGLVAAQNVWLRRKARRERRGAGDA